MFFDETRDDYHLLNETLNQLEFRNILNKVSNYCVSDLGKEQILLLKPSDSTFWLRKEHDLTGEMTDLIALDTELPLEGLSDIRTKLHKSLIENAVLTAPELLNVRDVIRVSRLIRNYFSERDEKYPNLFEEILLLHHNVLLEKHISDAIDESGEVRDNASRELSRIRRSILDKSNRLRSRLQNILKRVVDDDLAQEDFFTLREGRFVLPVKAEHKRHISGIIHGVSQTGSTVFLEPSEIIELNNELSLLLNEEKREVYKILSNLTKELGSDARQFLQSVDIIAHLDSIIAKARYALEYGGLKPVIHEIDEIYLKNIRHPILVHSKGAKHVIPLGIEFSEKKRGHLISGPNAGGKTVALKSVGLNLAMALSGIFPLGECRTNIRTIFTSIGDQQSIENDLSTFSSQIIRLKEILFHCSREALILVDEIGSGTDPQEGAALAAGILDTFLHLNVFFIATTHQSSLKTYALNREEIENDSLEFDEKGLKPTYKFLTGIPGNSYAFVLARNLGLSELVLERANNYLDSRQKELEKSISILSQYRSQAEELHLKTEQELRKAEKSKESYEQKFKEIKLKRQQYIDEAREEASDIIQNANALIENTIKEIREEKRSISEIKKDYTEKKEVIVKQVKKLHKKDESQISSEELNAGDNVILIETNSDGIILEVDNESKIALVEFNGLKFRLPFNQIRKTSAPKIKKGSYSEYIKFDTKASIDVRGQRAEATLRQLDEYINNAIVSNSISMLTIIHGKGTGALRQAIHEYLSSNPSIKSFRLGELIEGGAGVTVVEI